MSNSKQCKCGVKMLCCGCNAGPVTSNAGDRYNCVNKKISKSTILTQHNVASGDTPEIKYYPPSPERVTTLQSNFLDKYSTVIDIDNTMLNSRDISLNISNGVTKNILRSISTNDNQDVKSYLFIPILKDTPFNHTLVTTRVEVAKSRYFGTVLSPQYINNYECFFYNAHSKCYSFDAVYCSFPVGYPDLWEEYEKWIFDGYPNSDIIFARASSYDITRQVYPFGPGTGFHIWFFFWHAWNKYPPDTSTDYPWNNTGKVARFLYANIDEALNDKRDYRTTIYADIPEKSPDEVTYGLYLEIGDSDIDFNIDYETLSSMRFGELRTSYTRHIFKEIDNRNHSWILGHNSMLQLHPEGVPDTGNNLGNPCWVNSITMFGKFDGNITNGDYPDLDNQYREKLKSLVNDRNINLVHNDTDSISYDDLHEDCKSGMYNGSCGEYRTRIDDNDFMTSVNIGLYREYSTHHGYFDQKRTVLQDTLLDIGVEIIKNDNETYILIKNLIQTGTISDTGSWRVDRSYVYESQRPTILTRIESSDNNYMREYPENCYKEIEQITLSDYKYSLYTKKINEETIYPMVGPIVGEYRPVVDKVVGDSPSLNLCRMADTDEVINGWGGDSVMLFCPSNASVSCSHTKPSHSLLNLSEGKSDTDLKISINSKLNKLTDLILSPVMKSDTDSFDILDYNQSSNLDLHNFSNFRTHCNYLGYDYNLINICTNNSIDNFELKFNTYKPNTTDVMPAKNSLNQIHKDMIVEIRRNFTPQLEFDCVKLKGNTNTGEFVHLKFGESDDNVDNGEEGQYYFNEYDIRFSAIETEYTEISSCYDDIYSIESCDGVKIGLNYYPKKYYLSMLIYNDGGYYINGGVGKIIYNDSTKKWTGDIPLSLIGPFVDRLNYTNNIEINGFGFIIQPELTIDEGETATFSHGVQTGVTNPCKNAANGFTFTGVSPIIMDIVTFPVVTSKQAIYVLTPYYKLNDMRKISPSLSDILQINDLSIFEEYNACLF